MNPFGDTLYGAGTDLIKTELGAYEEKLFRSGSAYVPGNISRYFSNPQYYFQVSDQYVMNKLKLILFPFLHKGHWMRATETVGGEFSYKPPIHDINAPDLYIPLMAFGTYVVLAGFFLGINGKQDPMESLLLCSYIVGMFLYGNAACEDHEENSDCGGEKV
ncbi:hypothetical protein POUND7_011164 [Theobroma cacao]